MLNEGGGFVLEGKNTVITGSRRGIGRATVECFAKYGAGIWACARKPDSDFEADMNGLSQKYGVRITPVYFDMNNDEEMKAAVKEISAQKLSVDILVNNAGVPHGSLLQMMPMNILRDVFEVNYFSQMRLTQMILRKMIRQKSGSIINIVSVEGLIGNPGNTAYGASKAALSFATKSIAKETAVYGIRVNAVAPGLTDTDMAEIMEEGARKNMLEACAMNRLGRPEEIAEAISFLASDRASFITGQILRVDGGM